MKFRLAVVPREIGDLERNRSDGGRWSAAAQTARV